MEELIEFSVDEVDDLLFVTEFNLRKIKRRGFDPSKQYVRNCFSNSVDLEAFSLPKEYRCFCKNSKCKKKSCSCIINNTQKYECNINCSCQGKCNNFLTNKSKKLNLEVKYFTREKGIGIISLDEIPKGEFVCCYSGEIIKKDEGEKRIMSNYQNRKSNYVLKIIEEYGTSSIAMYIDSSEKGNYSRFFNHSCDPNLSFEIIRNSSFLPQICFFTNRTIEKGEELCFNYIQPSSKTEVIKSKKRCCCGSKSCNKYLPSY